MALNERDKRISLLTLSIRLIILIEAYDKALITQIDGYQPDIVWFLLAFMRILSPLFVNHYQHKLLNIHPSLLPKYPGLHTHKQVIENKDTFHGTTVHFVTEEVGNWPDDHSSAYSRLS